MSAAEGASKQVLTVRAADVVGIANFEQPDVGVHLRAAASQRAGRSARGGGVW